VGYFLPATTYKGERGKGDPRSISSVKSFRGSESEPANCLNVRVCKCSPGVAAGRPLSEHVRESECSVGQAGLGGR
jgi:hypothetical protein